MRMSDWSSDVCSSDRLDLDGFDNSFAYLHGGGTTGGDITLDGATLTVTTGTGAANFGGVISGAGAFVMNGASVQRLSGCDSSYTGTTTINAGSLYVDCLDNGGSNSSIGAIGRAHV